MGMTKKEKQEFNWLADAVGKITHDIVKIDKEIKQIKDKQLELRGLIMLKEDDANDEY
jgi:hypothetical protein